MSIENNRLTLASLYGPNSDNPAFYQTISSKMNEIGNETIIWCGDFNMVLFPEVDYCNYITINNNQRTSGPVNAHLMSWPSKVQNIQNLEIYGKEMTLTFNTHIPS